MRVSICPVLKMHISSKCTGNCLKAPSIISCGIFKISSVNVFEALSAFAFYTYWFDFFNSPLKSIGMEYKHTISVTIMKEIRKFVVWRQLLLNYSIQTRQAGGKNFQFIGWGDVFKASCMCKLHCDRF